MRSKVLISLTIGAMVFVGLLAVSSRPASAAKKVVSYEIARKVNLTDQQVQQMLMEGWSLGGVYQDCGAGAGEMPVMLNINQALLPFYQQLAERNKKEIMAALNKQFSASKANDIMAKIVEGKDKLTTYGDNPENQALQGEFDRLQRAIAEMQQSPAPKGMMKLDDLIADIQKFAKEGTVSDINAVKMAMMCVQMILEKHPEQFINSGMSTTENADRLEKLRKAVNDSLARIEQLGGAGCRMTFVFYKAK